MLIVLTAFVVLPVEYPIAPDVYTLIRIRPVGVFTPDGDARKTWARQICMPHRNLRAALQDPAAARILQGQQDPAGWLARNLIVDWPGEADVLRVGLNGVRPEDAVVLVNAVAGAFIRTEIPKRRQEVSLLIKSSRETINAYQKDIPFDERLARELPADNSERKIRLDRIAARQSKIDEYRMLLDRLERAEALGWPEATVIRRAGP